MEAAEKQTRLAGMCSMVRRQKAPKSEPKGIDKEEEEEQGKTSEESKMVIIK